MTKKKQDRKKRKNSKQKGGRAERAVKKLFSDWSGYELHRTPMSGALATLGVTVRGVDLHGDLLTFDESFPFTIEVKHHEDWTLDKLLTSPKFELWDWWAQVKRDSEKSGKIPALIFRRNNMPWYIMMDDPFASALFSITFETQDKKVYIGLLEDLFTNSTVEDWKEDGTL